VEANMDIITPVRVTLAFKSAKFEPLRLLGNDVTSLLPQPKVDFRTQRTQGYIDTTFVDQDMRVGRSPGGSLFVFVREKRR